MSGMLGELALLVSQPRLAHALLQDAIAQDPEATSPRALLAVASASDRNFERASREIEAALERAPESDRVQEAAGDVWALRARSEPEAGHLARARSFYERAVELAPDLPSPLASLGATYVEEPQCALAHRGIELLARARELVPWHPGINLSLGRLYQRLGQAEAARERFRFVTTLAHSDEVAEQARTRLRELDGGKRPDC
jgi:tetratricopeptide (TPR) repeat protein